MARCVIFSAPSGSGKSTIIQWLMQEHPELRLAFSVSATSRPPRGEERDGVDYDFLSHEAFMQRAEAGEFVEWEEVYAGRYYGTLRSTVERQLREGKNVIFDVDVKGGLNIKKAYGERALSVFIQPPSVEELRRRLTARATDEAKQIEERLAKAEWEMAYAKQFDCIVVNDDLAQAEADALAALRAFLCE